MVEEFDVADTSAGYHDTVQEPMLRAVSGGAELIAMFGYVPWFHDDEIERLELASAGRSRLIIKSMIYGSHVEPRACRVTFEIDEIVELRLEHFYRLNALFSIRLQRAGILAGFPFGAAPSAEDIDIVIEAAVGLEGVIRCRGLSVSFQELPQS